MDPLDLLMERLKQFSFEVEDDDGVIRAESQADELTDALADAYRMVVTTGANPFSVMHGSTSGPSEELIAACEILDIDYDSRFQTDAHLVRVTGELDDPERRTPMALQNDGDLIYLLGSPDSHDVDFKRERLLGDIMIAASRDGLLNAAHPVTEHGFLHALAQMALMEGKGARFWMPDGVDAKSALFSSAPGRIICVVPRSEELRFSDMCIARYVPVHRIGVVDGDVLEFQDHFAIEVSDLPKGFQDA